jgi:hypothetical protein
LETLGGGGGAWH